MVNAFPGKRYLLGHIYPLRYRSFAQLYPQNHSKSEGLNLDLGQPLDSRPDLKPTYPQEAATLLNEAARTHCCLRCLASHRASMQERMHLRSTFVTIFCDLEVSLGLAKFSVLDHQWVSGFVVHAKIRRECQKGVQIVKFYYFTAHYHNAVLIAFPPFLVRRLHLPVIVAMRLRISSKVILSHSSCNATFNSSSI
jgi:hypothetical protein